MTCLAMCCGGWALFLLWAVVLYANHDPSLPVTLTAAIVAVLSCSTLGAIGWAGLDQLDRRAAERSRRLEAAIDAAAHAAGRPVPHRTRPATGVDPEVIAALAKLRRRMQVIDRSVRH
jgi:hypothetical protein